VCCRDIPGAPLSCLPASSCNAGFACDGIEDCGGGDECCYRDLFSAPRSECASDCVDGGGTAGELVLDCSGAHNCPQGQLCCVRFDPVTIYYRAECSTREACTMFAGSQACSQAAECDTNVCAPYAINGVTVSSEFLKTCQ
jgi:hypothetical protein